ncbi:E3 ubiquitin-protein ligase ATL41-like [Corylus avellana]|uniref:E3 ubiquitin-protein ligase ATL41-like n=1 Tax=Corylus avellana TaxID=13451 RepID=UPI001E2007CB|nr:E3 ubiquitin-protein ligase ATL41-like [Corylus avellana]
MGRDDDIDDEGNRFGISSKIMGTAIFSLFAVVVIIVLLHIYARYLLRRQERRQRDSPYRATTTTTTTTTTTQAAPDDQIRRHPAAGKGLDPMVIASLPKLTHKPSDHSEAVECSICLSTVGEAATVRVLPNCKHMFHVECVDVWLSSNTTCPICRTAAEPRVVHPVQPTAPPAEFEKAGGSGGSRVSSFRTMLSMERSSRRVQSCGDHDEVGAEDLERQ